MQKTHRAAQESRGGAAHSVTPAALTFNLAFEPLTFFTYLVTYQHGSPTVAAKAIFGSSGNTVISVVLSTQVGQRLQPNWDLWHTKVCLFIECFIYLLIFFGETFPGCCRPDHHHHIIALTKMNSNGLLSAISHSQPPTCGERKSPK